MKNINFGIEIEMRSITREMAAKIIAEYFGTTVTGSTAKDNEGRLWKLVRDGSINDENGGAELVSPILQYKDIETLQKLIRLLRKNGAKVDKSCGIHIHIDAKDFTPKTIRNLINIIYSKEEMLYKALKVDKLREEKYCQKTDEKFLKKLNEEKPESLEKLSEIWYDTQAPYSDRNAKYNKSRYHDVNLHATFTKGTIEFRLFNGTLHAGEIKSYIQFCLALAHQALTQKKSSCKKSKTDNEKYSFRVWMIHLGLIGDEFKTCRYHFLKNLKGNSAFRHAA